MGVRRDYSITPGEAFLILGLVGNYRSQADKICVAGNLWSRSFEQQNRSGLKGLGGWLIEAATHHRGCYTPS